MLSNIISLFIPEETGLNKLIDEPMVTVWVTVGLQPEPDFWIPVKCSSYTIPFFFICVEFYSYFWYWFSK